MSAGEIVTVVNVVGVGGVAHRGGSAGKAKLVRCADDGNVTLAKQTVGQLQTCVKLLAAAADGQCAHQVHKAALQPVLDFCRQVLPTSVEYVVF